MPHAAVEGHHVTPEAAVLLVAADDALVGALEDADDAALGALGPAAFDARDDPVSVEGLADVRGGDEDVGLALAAGLGHDEAEPAGVAGEAAHDEVHAVGKADPRAADVDEGAVRDEAPEDRLQLAPPGRAKGELAHEVAHPAIEAV